MRTSLLRSNLGLDQVVNCVFGLYLRGNDGVKTGLTTKHQLHVHVYVRVCACVVVMVGSEAGDFLY